MSPHLRNLLEEAADDGGRPVGLDLAAVRTAGRRATWRQRALVGGGGIAAAAVITSIALVVAPGGSSPSGPSTGTTSTPAPIPSAVEPELAGGQVVTGPLIDALADRGYDVAETYGMGGGGGTDASGDEAPTASASVMSVRKAGAEGSAVVAGFNDRAALALITKDALASDDLCAAIPGNVEGFAWECETQVDGDYLFATHGDDAVGVTLVRPDGSGVSISLSTEPYDLEPAAAPAPPLDAVPMTHLELVEVVELIAAAPPPPAPTDVPTAGGSPPPSCTALADSATGELEPETGDASDSVIESAGQPGDEPCPQSIDPISADPLVEALAALSIEATGLSESMGGGSDGPLSTVLQFHLTDDAGRAGSAAIGLYGDLESAGQMGAGGTGASIATWCAVAPSEQAGYAWNLAEDPTTACDGIEPSGTDQTLVLVHDEAGAGAIGATLVRADGSVVSVSVSQAPRR